MRSSLLFRRWRRVLLTLIPLALALLHVSAAMPLPLLERLDQFIYDARLRLGMSRTLDERIVIVDIDEKSIDRIGRWPWGRDKLADLTQELFARQRVSVVGFDVVFAERDNSSGLASLRALERGPLAKTPGFAEQLARLAPSLDHDALFARSLHGHAAVLGYYFTSDRQGHTQGALPLPVVTGAQLRGRPLAATTWNGYGANLSELNQAAAQAGFFNTIGDSDGVVRSLPLLAEYQGQYYESLALAMFRAMMGGPTVEPGFPATASLGTHDTLESVVLVDGARRMALPVDERLAMLIPFRGPGGPEGGSYAYISASDLLEGKIAEGTLADKAVLIGTSAPGLQDVRTTPAGPVYPGVEAHASMLTALMDGSAIAIPDYARGFDVLQLLMVGLVLALGLSVLPAGPALLLSAAVFLALTLLNFWLYRTHGLAMPLATALALVFTATAVNIAHGYLFESRAKRALASRFRSYVPPPLVDEMLKHPEHYSMQADSRELTVMFCDMRGFTALSECMPPLQLQALLNRVFTRLTEVIQGERGTVDKYMGDCVMAFWGAPVPAQDHAACAVRAALGMARAVEQLNQEHRAQGLPEIGVGIGLNTGLMCVGDMGSNIRLSYTVIGDAVNLGSRLEGLCKTYGVAIIASESTQSMAPGFVWQELDRVRVKGKAQSVNIYTPWAEQSQASALNAEELACWQQVLAHYRAQDWAQCGQSLAAFRRQAPQSVLYALYASRLEEMMSSPPPSDWDGATHFDTK
ncbi:adenylate/guanylate cyclase domain-containing protein [uncultured Acidovorax sp.]|uniref:CHASE2 domain-containing protein n=1 Tax=uncultured Acidovorax sp. TaxID=158751 RepID=UPI002582667E|nr:adenylate/guanylate cyclase domain-containing protein [uncultured Acidovorax sp.]